MITVRDATLDDVAGIRNVFQSEYGEHYAYPQYNDTDALARMVYTDGSILLVAVETETNRIAGTASVVFSVGAHNDLIGEFGRLVVHPEFRGCGIGKRLMEARVAHVESRLHVGIVENRTSHTFSQQISSRFGFVPVGFIPMKLLVERRESIALFVRYFSDALKLRRNNPRIIPEASPLAGFALENCDLPVDAIIDDTSAPYPHDDSFELEELKTEGYASLLRIERGRLRDRDVFGPIRLHYGLFQLRARDSHYLIARRENQVAAGIGFMVDDVEKAVRVFELISIGDEPIRFLLCSLLNKCRTELGIEYVEVDTSAYSPRMQRTLLELGFLPVGYIPANVFHEVERLDVIKMSRLLISFDVGEPQFCETMKPIANVVISKFASKEVLPQMAAASQQAPLFAGLSDEQRQRLLRICEAKSFQSGEPIFRQGEKDGTMHLVLAGEVDLVDSGSREVATITIGQCVGETALLGSPTSDTAHSVTAIAKVSVETAAIPNRDFFDLIRRRPDIGVVIYRNLAVDVSNKLKSADGCCQ